MFLAISETFVSEFLVFFFCHQMFLKGFNSFKSPSTYSTIQNFARWHTLFISSNSIKGLVVPFKQDRARLYLVVTFATMPENTYIMTRFWQHRASITLHAERIWTSGQGNVGSQFDHDTDYLLKSAVGNKRFNRHSKDG